MNATPRRVLIVDDDETYRTALVRALERRGCTVFSASSVSSALALIESEQLDHASIDLRMPGGSGLELVRRLKALQPAAVIVVLTGYGSIATAVEAVKLGAADYLSKPADAADLLRAFEAAMPGAAVASAAVASAAVVSAAVVSAAVAGPVSSGAGMPPPAAASRAATTAAVPPQRSEVPSLARVEWEHISRVLADCGGNISQAARLLRMQRRSLQRKLAKYPTSK